mmetsp:Transcript_49950/g.109120  ORF Transcript_49950/g.109120 Transcript_49950/m.109120 type:complete len:276 (+) Transcript_49950:2121-2948(+)
MEHVFNYSCQVDPVVRRNHAVKHCIPNKLRLPWLRAEMRDKLQRLRQLKRLSLGRIGKVDGMNPHAIAELVNIVAPRHKSGIPQTLPHPIKLSLLAFLEVGVQDHISARDRTGECVSIQHLDCGGARDNRLLHNLVVEGQLTFLHPLQESSGASAPDARSTTSGGIFRLGHHHQCQPRTTTSRVAHNCSLGAVVGQRESHITMISKCRQILIDLAFDTADSLVTHTRLRKALGENKHRLWSLWKSELHHRIACRLRYFLGRNDTMQMISNLLRRK